MDYENVFTISLTAYNIYICCHSTLVKNITKEFDTFPFTAYYHVGLNGVERGYIYE